MYIHKLIIQSLLLIRWTSEQKHSITSLLLTKKEKISYLLTQWSTTTRLETLETLLNTLNNNSHLPKHLILAIHWCTWMNQYPTHPLRLDSSTKEYHGHKYPKSTTVSWKSAQELWSERKSSVLKPSEIWDGFYVLLISLRQHLLAFTLTCFCD